MNSNLKQVFSIIFLTVIAYNSYAQLSCKGTANFSTTPLSGQACSAPLSVSFQNNSTNTSVVGGTTSGLNFIWRFHDGTTSNLTDAPNKIYSSIGTFQVNLIAIDQNQCRDTATKSITIGKPKVSFEIAPSVCVDDTISVVNTTSAGSFFWSFPNGTVVSATASKLTGFYSNTGTEKITLIAVSADGLCGDTLTKSVTVEQPDIDFTSNPTYACDEPVNIKFTPSSKANNIKGYNWTFGDSTKSTIESPTHQYFIPDSTYTKRGRNILTTKLVVETTAGCKATVSKKDTIHLVWARFVPDSTNGCAPLNINFNDSSRSNEPIVKWSYDFGDGTQQTFTTKKPHSHLYQDSGTYVVTLIAENNLGCLDTSASVIINLGKKVSPDFSIDNSNPCTSETVTFTNLTTNSSFVTAWNYSDEGNKRISHCYTDPNPIWEFEKENSSQSITLTAEHNGCYSQTTKSNILNVSGPIAKIGYKYDCISKNNIELIDSSQFATSVSWNLGDGNTSTSKSFTHTYADTGIYTITLTANHASCPSVIDTLVFEIRNISADYKVINPSLSPNDSILCGNVSYVFDASNSVGVSQECSRGYTWQFQDTSKRPVTTPVAEEKINLPKSGLQYVKLFTEDVNGCKDSISKFMRVYNLTPSYTISENSICFPDTVLYSDLSNGDTTLVQWDWAFGDNTSKINTTNNSESHIYTVNNDSSKFVNTLKITDIIGCEKKASKTITSYAVKSSVSFSPNIPNKCVGDTIKYTATDFTEQGSNLSFLWELGDGNIRTTQNPIHVYDTAGNYNVKVTFTEKSSGCYDDSTFVVNFLTTVGKGKDVVKIENGTIDSSYCGVTVPELDLKGTSPADGNYQWFNVGGTFNTPTNIDSVKISGTGIYAVELTSKFGCGKDTAYLNVFQDSTPIVSFITPEVIICSEQSGNVIATIGTGGSYNWYKNTLTSAPFKGPISLSKTTLINDTLIITANKTNSLVSTGDTALFIVEYSNACGPATDTATVIVLPQIKEASVTGPSVICEDASDTLYISSDAINYPGTQYKWNTNGAKPDSLGILDGKQIYSFKQKPFQTFYTVNVFNVSCGVTSERIEIQAEFKPRDISITTSDSTLCVGDKTTLIALPNPNKGTEPLFHAWFKNGIDLKRPFNETVFTPQLVAPDSASYFLTITNHCTDSLTDSVSNIINVVIDLKPDFSIITTGDTSLCQSGLMILDIATKDSLDLSSVLWSTGETYFPISVTYPKVVFPATYTVKIASSRLSACENTDSFKIDSCTANVTVPSAFSPNGDIYNNVFKIETIGVIDLFYSIFDRWGIKVFDGVDKNATWDGTINGELAPMGTYVWYAQFYGNIIGDRIEYFSKSGTVTLVR